MWCFEISHQKANFITIHIHRIYWVPSCYPLLIRARFNCYANLALKWDQNIYSKKLNFSLDAVLCIFLCYEKRWNLVRILNETLQEVAVKRNPFDAYFNFIWKDLSYFLSAFFVQQRNRNTCIEASTKYADSIN